MSLQNIEFLKPTGIFTNYIYKAIPLVFDESMSYYETLLGLLAYLKNTVIPTVNNNAEAIAELQKLFTELQSYVDNYFKNLDVQQEINNKLDQMVQDGTLQNILLNYSKTFKIYDTYQDFISDINNLSDDMKIITLGYYSIGDGGNSTYYITNKQNDNLYQIKLNDTLYASLILENPKKINILQLGIKNDGIFDNTKILNAIFNNLKLNYYTLYFPKGIYYFSDSLNINIACNILGDTFLRGKISYDNTEITGSIFKFNCANLINKNALIFTNQYKYSMQNIIILGNSYNINVNRENISDGTNVNNTFTSSILYDNVTAIYTNDWGEFKNLKIQGFSNYGMYINYYSIVDNCEFYFCNIGLYVSGPDNRCTNLRFYTCNLGIRIGDNRVGAAQFNNIRMDEIATYGIYIGKYASGCIITNYVGDYINFASVYADSCSNCTINNSKLNRCGVLYSGFNIIDIESGNLDKACGIYCKNLQEGNYFRFECSSSSNKDGDTSEKYYGPATAIVIGGNENQSPRNNFEILGKRKEITNLAGIPTEDQFYTLIISKDNGFLGKVKYMNNLIECMPLRNDPSNPNNLYSVAINGFYQYDIGTYINPTSNTPSRPNLISKYNDDYYLSVGLQAGNYIKINNTQ